MTQEAPKSGHVKTNAEQDASSLGQRASKSFVRPAATSAEHRSRYGNDAIPEAQQAQKDGAGMPPGYKPDTSVSFHAGKGDKPDQIKDADGTRDVSPANANVGGNDLGTLPKDHTYRDRVEAQARSLGIAVNEGETLEFLLWKIRMQASA
jgi:hypothetical protein